MAEHQRGKHWKWSKKGFKGGVFGMDTDKELFQKSERLPVDVDGEVGTAEWWKNLRKEKKHIVKLRKEAMQVKGNDRNNNYILKLTEALLRIQKMEGEANGVFGGKRNAPVTGNTFVVVMPDGKTEDRVIESTEVIDEPEGDGDIGEQSED